MIGFMVTSLQSLLITTDYDNSQLMTLSVSLLSSLDYERLLFCVTDLVLIYDSVTSIRWLTRNSWTLKFLTTELWVPYEWIIELPSQRRMTGTLELNWTFEGRLPCEWTLNWLLYSVRPEVIKVSMSYSSSVILCLSVATKHAYRTVDQQWSYSSQYICPQYTRIEDRLWQCTHTMCVYVTSFSRRSSSFHVFRQVTDTCSKLSHLNDQVLTLFTVWMENYGKEFYGKIQEMNILGKTRFLIQFQRTLVDW
jgi:hypothetical protein